MALRWTSLYTVVLSSSSDYVNSCPLVSALQDFLADMSLPDSIAVGEWSNAQPVEHLAGLRASDLPLSRCS